MSKPSGLQRTLRVLAATGNSAATAALRAGLDADEASVRAGAARALASRRDRHSHTELLRALPMCREDVRNALANQQVAGRLRTAAVQAITKGDAELCESACRYALDADDHELLPSLVETAIDGQHPFLDGLSSTAMQLARSLSMQIEAKQQGRDLGKRDPAFARRGALQSLGRAVDRYREHNQQNLLDAFLMLTTFNNTVLKMVLKDGTHAAHGPLLESLVTSPGYGAMDVLIHAIEEPESSQQLLALAAQRCDRPYVSRLMRRIGEQPGVRVTQNVRRLSGFGWAAKDRQPRLLAMAGSEQAAAMRLYVAADTSPEDRLELASLLIRRGRDEARAAACESLRRLQSSEVLKLLEIALKDNAPTVVAAAASQLRRHDYPNSLRELVMLLYHESPIVVASAQRALGEFSLATYRRVYASLSPEQRAAAGQLVGKADPEAAAEILGELRAPAIARRLEALRLVGDLAIVDLLYDAVVAATEHKDVGVRAEAARVLGGSANPGAVGVLTKLLDDKATGVQVAAKASLRELNSLEVVDQLVETLEGEFASGDSDGREKEQS